MIVLGLDPGPETCGVVLYDTEARRVLWSDPDRPVDVALSDIERIEGVDLVAIERVQASGFGIQSLFDTSRVGGRLEQRALDYPHPVVLLYRREVLSGLDATGRGNRDSLVRARLIEMHGGSRQVAMGKKASPGQLYGVSRDGWAALAVAVVAAQRSESP